MIARLTLACLLMLGVAHAEWEPLAALPEPNGGFATGFVDGRLIVAGGTNWKGDTKHWLDVIWSYDPAANRWSVVGKLPQPCAYAASGVIDGRLIIASGSDGQTALKDVISLDGTGKSQKLGEMPAGRIYSAATVLNNELLIAGGATDPAELKTLTTTMFRLSIKGSRVVLFDEPPVAREGFGIASAAAAGERAFVFGGARYHAATQVRNLRTIQVLNATEPKAQLPVATRGLSAVALSEQHIYVAGGYGSDEQGFSDQAWIFLATTGKLTPAKGLPIRGMVHFASDGEWLYCLGGEDQKKHRSDRMWRIQMEELLSAVVPP